MTQFFNRFTYFLKRIFTFALKVLTGGDSIGLRRRHLSKKISSYFNDKVAYGPFKGLILGRGVWSSTDKASMILGLYEREVLNAIANVPKRYTNFVDLGAADGYYAIGVLTSGRYQKSTAFEMTEAGRAVIKKNAALNLVSDRLEVFGKAENDFYKGFTQEELRKSVVLIDIEGAEFEILDKNCLEQLKESVVIIEIHDWKVKNGLDKKNALIENAKHFFKVEELLMSSRDLSIYPELRDFNDTDRWLICSEGRERLMTWIRLDPL